MTTLRPLLAAALLGSCQGEREQVAIEAAPELEVAPEVEVHELPRDRAGVAAWNRAHKAGRPSTSY